MSHNYFNLLKDKFAKARTICEICSKLTIKTLEPRQWGLSCVFIVNFELSLHIILLAVLVTLNKKIPGGLSKTFVLPPKAYNMQNLNQVKFIGTPEDKCRLKLKTKNI